MTNILLTSILAGCVSGFIVYLFVPIIIKFAEKIGIVDDPKKNKHPKVIHTYPVPRGGGLAISAGIIIASLIFLPLDKHLIGILSGLVVLAVVGVLDDKFDLNPYLRIVTGVIAAGLPIAAGIGIAFVANPLTGHIIDLSFPRITFDLLGDTKSIWVLSDIFALVWILFISNALNMGAKGIDGQLPGVAAIAAVVIAFLSLQFSADITQWPVIILAAVTTGSFLGFLPWNSYPQKIMPGYSGSTIAGYMLAVLSILATAKVGLLTVTLALPIADTLYSITRRLLQGKSPVWGDRGHLHHKLLDAGFTKKQVVYIYWAATAVLGALSLNLKSKTKLYTFFGIILVTGGVLFMLYTYLRHKTKNND